jgi:hypothetical protein
MLSCVMLNNNQETKKRGVHHGQLGSPPCPLSAPNQPDGQANKQISPSLSPIAPKSKACPACNNALNNSWVLLQRWQRGVRPPQRRRHQCHRHRPCRRLAGLHLSVSSNRARETQKISNSPMLEAAEAATARGGTYDDGAVGAGVA